MKRMTVAQIRKLLEERVAQCHRYLNPVIDWRHDYDVAYWIRWHTRRDESLRLLRMIDKGKQP